MSSVCTISLVKCVMAMHSSLPRFTIASSSEMPMEPSPLESSTSNTSSSFSAVVPTATFSSPMVNSRRSQ